MHGTDRYGVKCPRPRSTINAQSFGTTITNQWRPQPKRGQTPAPVIDVTRFSGTRVAPAPPGRIRGPRSHTLRAACLGLDAFASHHPTEPQRAHAGVEPRRSPSTNLPRDRKPDRVISHEGGLPGRGSVPWACLRVRSAHRTGDRSHFLVVRSTATGNVDLPRQNSKRQPGRTRARVISAAASPRSTSRETAQHPNRPASHDRSRERS